ncbi:IS1096 element passenger TnpR family protein [Thiocapsa sp.]|uniref:IS1096 element passenger TnpR family protein n=1 Tax=Thiocapsa sp. TaxID=2024551 RepID=UPI002CE840B4|nr:hypothetical protein [Thiocapsa sp.]HSO84637.1 hypothetical protein [Thiocapsa sp.]
MLSACSALNDTERYFALLKAWWGRRNNALIGEPTRRGGDLTAQVIDFAKQCLTRGCPQIEHQDAMSGLKYRPGLVNLALLELFGLFEIQVMPPEEGQGWRPNAIALTSWGHALLGTLVEARHQAGATNLAALASTILTAFDFDHDHLNRFSYQNRYGQTVEIDHSALVGETDNAVADEVRIGDLSLTEGQQIEFRFDFGDDWRFGILVERPEAGPVPAAPLILETHGEAPAQYGEG